MKKTKKNIYIVTNKDYQGKEVECETLEEAKETREFLTKFSNNNNFIIESKEKIIYEIEKGDKVYWGDNKKRVDVITDIIKDAWGDIRYKTKEVNGNKRGIAYKKDINIVL